MLDQATLDAVAAFHRRFADDPAGGLRFDQTFREIADAFRGILSAAHVSIWVPSPAGVHDNAADAGVLHPAFSTFPPHLHSQLRTSAAIDASRGGRAFLEGRARYYTTPEEPPTACAAEFLRASGLPAMWAVPIISPSQRFADSTSNPHHVIAVALSMLDADARAGEISHEVLRFFGSFAGKQIERALWAEQDLVVNQAYAALDLLQTDRHAAMDAVSCAIRAALGFEACTILQADDSRKVLSVLGTTGIDSRISRRKLEYQYGFSLSGTVALAKHAIASEDVRQNDRWGSSRLFPDIVQTPDRFQYLGAPLLSNAGEILGVIRLRNKIAPDGAGWSTCLNRLDRMRIERVARVIAPLMALMIRETEMSGAMKRIQHDIDMPATAIRDGAGMLRRRNEQRLQPDLTALRQRTAEPDLLGRIAAETDQIRQKLEDIESFAEILLVNSELRGIFDADDLELSPQHVLLVRDVVAKLCKMLTPLAREKDLSGILYSQHTLFAIPALWVDPRLIEIALYNLLQNALKYGNPDTVIVVDGEAARLDGKVWYTIHVKNYGIGVAEEDAPRIFDRYFRAAKARKRSVTGLGIGLSTARAIIERHGGRLVLTQRDNPTIFSIQLPEYLATRKPE